MFKRIQRHIKEQLGSDNVRLILADADGRNLFLYSNLHGNGYKRNTNGIYQKYVPLDEIPEREIDTIKGKDTKFYGPTRRYTRIGPEGQYTSIEFREPDPAETGILSSGTSYGYCRTDRLARVWNKREYGFSAESGIVHEGAHGVISLVDDQLEDLFEYDEFTIVDESVATLVGIKYMERFLSEEATKYKDFIAGYETDPIHMEAFRLVLQERDRVEDMRNVVKLLLENPTI